MACGFANLALDWFLNDNRRMFTVRHYLTADARDPFQEWIRKLRDPVAKGQIVKRLNRVGDGNFGDHKFCRDGVWELRVDHGPGSRLLRNGRHGGGIAALWWKQEYSEC